MSRRLIYLGAGLVMLVFFFGAVRGGERDPRLKALGEARLGAARVCYDRQRKLFESGEVTSEPIYMWSRRILDSQRDLAVTDVDRAQANAEHLARMRNFQKFIATQDPKFCMDATQTHAVDYWVKEAEFWIASGR